MSNNTLRQSLKDGTRSVASGEDSSLITSVLDERVWETDVCLKMRVEIEKRRCKGLKPGTPLGAGGGSPETLSPGKFCFRDVTRLE